jgi:hypothetical protein
MALVVLFLGRGRPCRKYHLDDCLLSGAEPQAGIASACACAIAG